MIDRMVEVATITWRVWYVGGSPGDGGRFELRGIAYTQPAAEALAKAAAELARDENRVIGQFRNDKAWLVELDGPGMPCREVVPFEIGPYTFESMSVERRQAAAHAKHRAAKEAALALQEGVNPLDDALTKIVQDVKERRDRWTV